MRAAFRKADKDDSGELNHDEIRELLRQLGKDVHKTEKEIETYISEFIKLADKDNSGEVSFEEYKMAIVKTRETSKRTLSLRIDGYEPIENISIDILGSTLVYELIPKFEDDIPGDIAVER